MGKKFMGYDNASELLTAIGTKIKAKYTKPNTGIPKSDLATAVQTSLGKADSAVQPVTMTEALAAKQNSLSETQLAAVNSGINSTKVEQISTNQTNILYAINTGVKNILPVDSCNVSTGTYLLRDYEMNVPAGNYIFYINITSATATGIQIITSIGADDGQHRTGIKTINPSGSTGVITESMTILTGTTCITLYVNGAAVIPEIMLCPKELWDTLDHTFQHGALPNYDLTRGLAELNAHPFLTIPFNHNMVYRGKNLGDTLTADQDTALSSGNFTDLYLGDYWTKSVSIPAGTYTGGDGEEVTVPAQTVTLKAVIADFDTFYAGYASTYAGINTHHAAVIVTGFSNVVWNKTNSTAGGYVASLIHKWLVGSALPQIETWFGSAKVLSHQKLLTNAITGDAASGWAWSSQKISLLSENQMYGSKVWGNSKAANGGYEPGEAFKHLNVFNHIDANLLFGNRNIWLRDIASAVWAAYLNDFGIALYGDASAPWIAPAALILLS